jgi:hypothetical protein
MGCDLIFKTKTWMHHPFFGCIIRSLDAEPGFLWIPIYSSGPGGLRTRDLGFGEKN